MAVGANAPETIFWLGVGMESLWEWLADTPGQALGRASGDDALLGALLEAAVETIETAAGGTQRLTVVVGGCQADPSHVADEIVDRAARVAAAVAAVRCSAACSGSLAQTSPLGDLIEIVRIPTLHQTDTGPFVIISDPRSGFGFVLVSRRLDLPAEGWRSATHEIAWSLSPEATAAALRHLAGRVRASGGDALPRALASAVIQPAHSGGLRARAKARTKPGTTALKTASPLSLLGADTAAAVAGRLLGTLQIATAHECALAALAAELERGRDVEEALDASATLLGRALDASRVAIILRTAVAPDDAPTAKLPGLGSLDDIRQGVYTRIDTRRLEPLRLDRDSGPAVSRHATPIVVERLSVGEIRVTDTRAGRTWTPMERALLDRAARLIARSLADVAVAGPPDSKSLRATDRLTGLEHRGVFERRMKAALGEAERTGEPVSLVRLRIDGLADINEAYGYAAGDGVIRVVAALLRERLADDEESTLARFAGEGFAILLPGFTRLAASRVADLLVTSIADTEMPPVGRVQVRAGVATFPDCASTAEGLASVARNRMLA